MFTVRFSPAARFLECFPLNQVGNLISFLDKSNLRLVRKEIKENTITKRPGEKNEKKGRNSVVENKEKNHFWCKWMSFLRKHWSGRDMLQPDRKSKTIDDTPLEKWRKPGVTSPVAIENPPEENTTEKGKNSKILIKPTRSGIKAMVAQYGRPALNSDTSVNEGNKPVEVRREVDSPGCRRTLVREKRTEISDKRPKWNATAIESEACRSSESTLQSTLFIQKNTRETIECSVLYESNLPSDHRIMQSKRSDEINKKSKKPNKRPINCRVADERKRPGVHTCKTVSEPTWNERKKILQQQQLQDNINNLLEQFMYLEAEDIIDLTLSQRRLTEYKKKIEPHNNSAKGMRDFYFSREVSPQVLVNIKPFKEQVSHDFLPLEGSPEESDCSTASKGTSKKYKEQKNELARSIHKSRSNLTKKFEDLYFVDRSARRTVRPNVQVLTHSTTVIDEICQTYREKASPPNFDAFPKTPTCTVWGVYKSYSACKNAGAVKARKEEKTKMKVAENSFDELLNYLDDSDHDVFQKNISQFRKKITPKPEFDENQPGPINPSKTSLKNVIANTNEGKLETFRFESCRVSRGDEPKNVSPNASKSGETLEDIQSWKGELKPRRTLENVYLLLSETKLLGFVLATRIEAGTIGWSQMAKEISDMVERSTLTVVESSGPSVGDSLESWEEKDKAPLFVARDQYTSTASLGINWARPDGFGEPKPSISEILRSCPKLLREYYVLPKHRCIELLQKHESSRNGISIGEPAVKMRVKQTEKGKQTVQKQIPRNKKKELLMYEQFFEPACGVVQILNTSPYGYGIVTSDEFPSSSVSTLWNAREKIGAKTSVSSSRLFIDEASGATDRETTNSTETLFWVTQNLSKMDSSFDGFHIIYNNIKKTLNDDDDETIKSIFLSSLSERKRSCAFTTEESPSPTGNKKTSAVRGSEKRKISKSPEKKESRTLKFKCNSAPKENLPRVDFIRLDGSRPGRSLVLPKDTEKDSVTFRKRRLSLDREAEIERGVMAPSVEKESTNVENLPVEKSEMTSEEKCLDKQKTFLMEKKKSNVRKEIVAAFNSIKEINVSRGEVKSGTRRMSLLIMLAKK